MPELQKMPPITETYEEAVDKMLEDFVGQIQGKINEVNDTPTKGLPEAKKIQEEAGNVMARAQKKLTELEKTLQRLREEKIANDKAAEATKTGVSGGIKNIPTGDDAVVIGGSDDAKALAREDKKSREKAA